MTAKKIIGLLHLWLGLTSGLVVFILGLTGCIYVFEDEIREIVYHDRLYVQAENTPRLPVSILLSNAQQHLGKGYPITNYQISNAPSATARFMAYKSNEEAISYFGIHEYAYNVYLNPYSGKVVHIEDNKFEFFTLVLYLHYDLFLGKIGKQIVGWSTVIFIVLLISGLVLWWPKNKAAAKQRYWFQWKDSTKWKRKNYDLHNIVGFYFMSVTLIIALTGLVWAFKWFNETVQLVTNAGRPSKKLEAVFSDSAAFQPVKAIDKIYADIHRSVPGAKSYSFVVPKQKGGAFIANALFEGTDRFRFTTKQYDQYSGKVLRKRGFADKDRGEKLRAMNYDIHVGSILGLPGKILAFLASLTATSLPITGFIIWWGRRNKSKKKNSPSGRGTVQGKKATKLPVEKTSVNTKHLADQPRAQ
ncbi:hypothetical protein DYBT9275_03099 [Dyadobacter sp. CECT 9275]|uniref:PepSY domain-containing protein n=1 Tax=Dyadobacter helix TaxID=2822344 RepID=A0A916NLX7_9BACT|nr:PepSY-associated TM helix domain-containing protein [Dyadobacter sp. CECT 9275]CAG5003216.1 hypothetical protein DYBT9275_03099 [Dyadobacter sp. CECT 9275]